MGALRELRERQISLALCCQMPDQVVAEALGLELKSVQVAVHKLIVSRGMADRFEFALQQNACVREQLWRNNS